MGICTDGNSGLYDSRICEKDGSLDEWHRAQRNGVLSTGKIKRVVDIGRETGGFGICAYTRLTDQRKLPLLSLYPFHYRL